MFCVKKVWLIVDTWRGMFVWLNHLTQKQGENLEMEKEYFMQPEQMQVVLFQCKFLDQDEWRSSDAVRGNCLSSLHLSYV